MAAKARRSFLFLGFLRGEIVDQIRNITVQSKADPREYAQIRPLDDILAVRLQLCVLELRRLRQTALADLVLRQVLFQNDFTPAPVGSIV